MKNSALNIANELDNQNQTQMGFDSKTSRQNFPTLPRNYFSSSYEHGCAMQEIMSSLQVSIEFIIVDVISKYIHKIYRRSIHISNNFKLNMISSSALYLFRTPKTPENRIHIMS